MISNDWYLSSCCWVYMKSFCLKCFCSVHHSVVYLCSPQRWFWWYTNESHSCYELMHLSSTYVPLMISPISPFLFNNNLHVFLGLDCRLGFCKDCNIWKRIKYSSTSLIEVVVLKQPVNYRITRLSPFMEIFPSHCLIFILFEEKNCINIHAVNGL